MEKMRAFMSTLVAGWDVATVREIVADTLHNVVEPLVYDEAVSLIEEHKPAGRDVVIVSTSGTEVVEPIGACSARTSWSRAGSRSSTAVHRQHRGLRYAEEKARAIVELAEERGYDLAAQLRLQRLRHRPPYARGGRPRPRGQPRQGAAQGRGRNSWPVLVFTKPVSLRSRVPAKPTLAALAVGGVVAVGGVLWANARRKRLGA